MICFTPKYIIMHKNDLRSIMSCEEAEYTARQYKQTLLKAGIFCKWNRDLVSPLLALHLKALTILNKTFNMNYTIPTRELLEVLNV